MEQITFLELFRRFIGHHRCSEDQFDKRSPNTIRAYSNRYLRVASYLYYKELTDILSVDFSITIAKDLFNYSLKHGFQHNTGVRLVTICSQVLDYGASNELIPVNPIAALKLRKTPPEAPPFYTPAQIDLWHNYKTTSVMRRKAADMFILQLHTGFDYGDFAEINRSQIVTYESQRYIVKKRNKNGNEAIIPISGVALNVLDRWNYQMRLLSNPVYNRTIKEVASELGLPGNITCKDGRKLFLMNKLNNEGYSLESVSKMAGHRSVKTTEQYYVNVNISRISAEVNKRAAPA